MPIPGDVITVYKGVYRERIDPPRGGSSDDKRIVYRAAPGEKVVIKGSEIAKEWAKKISKLMGEESSNKIAVLVAHTSTYRRIFKDWSKAKEFLPGRVCSSREKQKADRKFYELLSKAEEGKCKVKLYGFYHFNFISSRSMRTS